VAPRSDHQLCDQCGVLLASDNPARKCGPCARLRTNSVTIPPIHPSQFWDQTSIQETLMSQHFGQFLKAYREAHDPTIKQAQIGDWLNLTQGQVSRIERSTGAVHDIAKLSRWTKALHVPRHLLWFRTSVESTGDSDTWNSDTDGLIIEPVGHEGENVKRRKIIKLGGIAAAAVVSSGLLGGLRVITERECAEKLAWELWQKGVTAVHASELPLSVAAYLGVVDTNGKITKESMRISPGGLITGDKSNFFSFVQPSLIDLYVGQHIFSNVATGQSHLLATAQTSHETDFVLQKMIQQDESSVGLLGHWMKSGSTPVLRVNSAGVLAKIGNNHVTDVVVTTLKGNQETRQLYLTAVASRVLNLGWQQAACYAAEIEKDQSAHLQLSDEQIFQFSKEIHNPRDGAARWCSVVFLAQVNSESDLAQTALHHALQKEPCPENLRSIGNALIGNNLFAVQ
jgi:transcriptional regulator with XRE-family HTH domain